VPVWLACGLLYVVFSKTLIRHPGAPA